MLAPFFYTAKSFLIKIAPPANIDFFVFFRFFFDFLILLPFFIYYRKELKSSQKRLHFIRAIFVVLSIYGSVYGLRHLALVDAILLENTVPFFMVIITIVWKKTNISLRSFLILLLGFLSLFFILKPKLDIFQFASLASLGTGLAAAFTAVAISRLSEKEKPISILFYFNLFCCLLTFPRCFISWSSSDIPFISEGRFWLPFVLISIFGVFYQYVITKSYSLVEPYIVGGFIYFSVLFSALIGWFCFGETIDCLQIIGGLVLITTGILTLKEHVKLNKC